MIITLILGTILGSVCTALWCRRARIVVEECDISVYVSGAVGLTFLQIDNLTWPLGPVEARKLGEALQKAADDA
jgi:hypothetical protein